MLKKKLEQEVVFEGSLILTSCLKKKSLNKSTVTKPQVNSPSTVQDVCLHHYTKRPETKCNI